MNQFKSVFSMIVAPIIAPICVALVVGFVQSQFLVKELSITLSNHEARLAAVEGETKEHDRALMQVKTKVSIYHGSTVASAGRMNPR